VFALVLGDEVDQDREITGGAGPLLRFLIEGRLEVLEGEGEVEDVDFALPELLGAALGAGRAHRGGRGGTGAVASAAGGQKGGGGPVFGGLGHARSPGSLSPTTGCEPRSDQCNRGLIRSALSTVRTHMPNIGPLEIIIVLIIALVVFGPKRLPELGRSMGKGTREFRETVSGESDDRA
jgi:sec-independent protein translocase protein TatA